MKKAFRYRFYPSEEQKTLLAKTFGCCRFVWNWALRLRSDIYYADGKYTRYEELSSRLTQLKQQPELIWLREVSSVPLQQTLRHQEKAFYAFFTKRSRFPSFKKKHGKQSAEFTTSAFQLNGAVLRLAKMDEPLDIVWSRPIDGIPTTVTVTKDAANRYFVSILCECPDPVALPAIDSMIGVDLGLHDIAVTSNGFHSGNPKHLKTSLRKLKRAQRCLSRKQRGSCNRMKARLRIARIYARIRDKRLDFTHKLSTELIRENQAIVVESLAVKNMVKNHTLARAISDAGWSEFVRQLNYKATWYGRELIQIDRFYPSSKRCSHCGYVLDHLDLSTRQWRCPECDTQHDRDLNAARNILAAGLAERLNACGGAVRPATITGSPCETGT